MATKKIIYLNSPHTKYRMVLVENIWWLQYKRELRFLNLFKIYTWNCIWKPYMQAHEEMTYRTQVCSYNTMLSEFVAKWANIHDYFNWATREQQQLNKTKHHLSFGSVIISKRNEKASISFG